MKNLCKFAIVLLILQLLYMSSASNAETGFKPQDLKIVVIVDSHDIDSFKSFADEAKRFEDLGEVLVNISGLAEKAEYNMPDEGRNPWYEYTSWNATIYHFFPHESMKPYLPMDFVEKNKQLMLEKAKYLREIGLGAAVWSYDLRYMPDAYFEQYPELLGARVDHPRRSLKPAYCMDVDEQATLDIYTDMAKQLFTAVPEIGVFIFKVNDAGSGINWAGLQYDAPNGPTKHRYRSTGQRVANFIDAYNKGITAATGKTVPIFFEPRFQWPEETNEVRSKLPENAKFFLEFSKDNDEVLVGNSDTAYSAEQSIHIRESFGAKYPIRYIFNPLGILQEMQQLKPGSENMISLHFWSWYERGGNTIESTKPFFDVVHDFISQPVYGRIEILQKLRSLCDKWSDDGDALFNTFCDLNDAFVYAEHAFPSFEGIHGYVSSRLINRPCLIMPEKLTAEEEEYFMPYVFNLSLERARTNYMDNLDLPVLYTWTRREEIWPYQNRVRKFTARLNSIADRLESSEGQMSQYLVKSAAGLRVYASFIRTWENFYKMQVLREQNADKLSSAPHLPPQGSFTWQGDTDLIFMKQTLRDEVENVTELIKILEEHPDVIYTGKEARDEDIFVLGPDLVSQLKTKRRLMLEHYTDADSYMTVPLK